jgi:hypothetical protein
MHLAGAGVGEADIDPGRDEGSYQAFGAVHGWLSQSG